MLILSLSKMLYKNGTGFLDILYRKHQNRTICIYRKSEEEINMFMSSKCCFICVWREQKNIHGYLLNTNPNVAGIGNKKNISYARSKCSFICVRGAGGRGGKLPQLQMKMSVCSVPSVRNLTLDCISNKIYPLPDLS